jgi:hypothetical protein
MSVSTISQPGTSSRTEVPTFLVTVSDGTEVEEHTVVGLPRYRDNTGWLEFTVRRNDQTHVVALFPTIRVLSVIQQHTS